MILKIGFDSQQIRLLREFLAIGVRRAAAYCALSFDLCATASLRANNRSLWPRCAG